MKRGLFSLFRRRAGAAPRRETRRLELETGPVREHWILLVPRPELEPRALDWAAGLCEAGFRVSLSCEALSAGGEPEFARFVPFETSVWRACLDDPSTRIRVVVFLAEPSCVGFAREARAWGARIIYDKPSPALFPAAPRAFHPEDEKALALVADDLVAPDGATARLLASLAASGRLVHEFEAADEAGRRLPAVLEKPSIVVVLAGDERGEEIHATVDRLRAERESFPYRIAVVVGQHEGPGLDRLLAREEAGEFLLLRNPQADIASRLSLGVRGTGSEVLAFLTMGQLPVPGGWLREALTRLYTDARVGGVELLANGRTPAVELAAVSLGGLVLRRSVYRAAGGLGATAHSDGAASVDFSLRLRSLGYRLERCAPLALDGAQVHAALAEPELRELRRIWRHERVALDAAVEEWHAS